MVLLTAFYMLATGVQAWRLQTIYQKITRVLENKSTTIVFCKKSDGTSEGMTAALVSSDLCANASEVAVDDCFWSNDVSQGISVRPNQQIFMNPFITFPSASGLIPFNFSKNNDPDTVNGNVIYTLIETDLIPINLHEVTLEIESFGKMIAWKVDTRMAILLKTDTRKFSQLILSTFLHNNYLINDHLPLVRIQTVNIDGKPQDYEEIRNHSRKDIFSRSISQMSCEDWEKHLDGIKNLGVLASQAAEFEYKKNLTEGKTGIVQPDLISSKNIEESLLNVVSSPNTPKKSFLSLERTDEKLQNLKKRELLKSPMHQKVPSFPISPENGHADKSVQEKQIISPESPKFPTSVSSKSPSHSITSGIFEVDHPRFPLLSPAKKPSKNVTNDMPKIIMMEPKEKTQSPQEIVGETKNLLEKDKIYSEKFNNISVEPKNVEDEPTKIKSKLPPILTTITEPFSVTPNSPKLPSSKSFHSIRRRKQKMMLAKPPNILVYSDSVTTRNNVIKTLGEILKKNIYTVYPLTAQQIRSKIWIDNTTLLVVCGSINGSDIGPIFLDFFFRGGKILCLCSDLLRNVLPTYHTAEVREHELVQFTYGKWKNIKMMHHIFCYQPSPVRKHFSQESDDPPKERHQIDNPLLVLPRSVELKDQYGIMRNVNVQTLGTEDTWKTPSLLMVYTENGGKIVFSQIHLEVDPSIYENDDQKYDILKKNDGFRYEIFSDVLCTHLGLIVKQKNDTDTTSYTNGYFLGRHELKFEMLDQLKSTMEDGNVLKLEGLTVKFCGKTDSPLAPDANRLSVMIHSCPDDFSTLDYFETLRTNNVGRLLIYANVLASSMVLVNNIKCCNGYAVIPRELRSASGRGSNVWLNPPGCLMFSLQLHIPLNSNLGQRIPLLQHLVATAVVMSIKKQPGYENLEIGVKWPNDIYADSSIKIGGLIVNSLLIDKIAICNIGLGLNLSNSLPTTCINDMIAAYNKKHSTNLQLLTYEKTLAIIFNEIEYILNHVQSDSVNFLYDLYYKCWLHSDSLVTILTTNNQEKSAKILGIDDFGYLKIQLDDSKQISVEPDGNSFDMLRGLIIPKSN